MKTPRLYSSFIAATAFAAVFLTPSRAEDVPATIKFSKPDQPGTLKVILGHGDFRVQGADNTQEITVKSDSKVVNKPRKDGLRVLTASSSFSLSEKDNVVTLDTMADGWGGGSADFRVTVPRNTSVVVQSSWGGDVGCTNIAGDIDIKTMNGEIRLDEIAGGVFVETQNGEIRANIRELRENKTLSFVSINGEVVVRVPIEAKANVRLRTQNGAVLTDFDDKVLVTKTETTSATRQVTRRGPKSISVISPEARDMIRDTARAVAQAGREVSDATREGIDAARLKVDAARMRTDADRMKIEAEKARIEAERSGYAPAKPAAPPAPSAPGVAPAAPAAPAVPAIATITGGKLVTGTLNGGGPEISIATMNGDVTLRQLEKK